MSAPHGADRKWRKATLIMPAVGIAAVGLTGIGLSSSVIGGWSTGTSNEFISDSSVPVFSQQLMADGLPVGEATVSTVSGTSTLMLSDLFPPVAPYGDPVNKSLRITNDSQDASTNIKLSLSVSEPVVRDQSGAVVPTGSMDSQALLFKSRLGISSFSEDGGPDGNITPAAYNLVTWQVLGYDFTYQTTNESVVLAPGESVSFSLSGYYTDVQIENAGWSFDAQVLIKAEAV